MRYGVVCRQASNVPHNIMDIRLSDVNIHTEYGLRIWTFVNPDRDKNYRIGPISGVRAPSVAEVSGKTCGIQLGITVVRSDRVSPSLASSDLMRALDGQDEHLAVALLARVGRVGDGVDDVLTGDVRDDALDFDLLMEVDDVLLTGWTAGETSSPRRATGLSSRAGCRDRRRSSPSAKVRRPPPGPP